MSGGQAPLRIEVTRDKDDYLSGIWLNYWSSGGWGVLVVAAVALGAVLFIDAGDIVPSLLFAVLWGGFFCAVIYFTASRSWRTPGALEPIIYEFSDETLGVLTANGEGKTKWVLWKRALENERVFIIRHHANLVHILPKRQIDPSVRLALRALLTRVLDGRVRFKEDKT